MASLWTALRRWGGPGLLALGVIDSSLLPTLGSLDVFTAVLAARHRDLWWYYAGMSTAGSVVGAYVTYKLAYKAGMGWLQQKLGAKWVGRVNRGIQRWGVAAVFVPAIAPPPFPTSPFLAGAGALEFPLPKFMLSVASARVIRYGAIAYVAAHYGRGVIRILRHPQQYVGVSIAITLSVILVVVIASLLWNRRESHEHKRTAA